MYDFYVWHRTSSNKAEINHIRDQTRKSLSYFITSHLSNKILEGRLIKFIECICLCDSCHMIQAEFKTEILQLFRLKQCIWTVKKVQGLIFYRRTFQSFLISTTNSNLQKG